MRYLSKKSHPESAVTLIHLGFSHSLSPLSHAGRITHLNAWKQVVVALTLCLLVSFLFFPALSAADEGPPGSSRGLGFGLAATPIYQFPAKVSGGGDLSITRLIFNADISKQVDQKLGLGLGFSYEFADYGFSGLTNFPVSQPWKEVQRLGFSLPIIYALNNKWRLLVIPTFQLAGEFGARWGDALAYGGAIAVTYAFRPDAVFGFGLAGYANIEEARVFPFPLVNWQITNRLRLTNPFRTSPAGPAGLELSYALTKQWTVGVGGAYRSDRFRLDASGPIPNGIGEYKSIPTFVRLSYKPVPAFGIDFYSGISFLNKIYVNAPDGDNLYTTKHSAAPLLGVGLSGRF
jgi:hypothetical protein